MKLLIIGSKGFIGKQCEAFFVASGHDVWTCDIVNDYNSKNYFLIDATNSDYHSIFQEHSFDVCINCSGAASVPLSIEFPFRDYMLNTVNVYKLLDAIRLYQPNCKFITLSSAAVYGNPERLPIVEDQSKRPVSPYGAHKFQAEQICHHFSSFYNIKTCCLRIFSAYGDGLKKQLFWDLFQKAKTMEMVELFGNGNESRDFIHIEDLVQAINILVNSQDFKYPMINIANGKEVFIKDAVSLFYNSMNKHIEYKFRGEGRKGDPSNWVADITKLKSIGYQQKVPLDQGLKRYILWAMTV